MQIYPRNAIWPPRIVAALTSLGGEARLADLYVEIQKAIDEPLAPNWRSSVRQTLQCHCPQSPYFSGKEALFEHKVRGTWRLRPQKK